MAKYVSVSSGLIWLAQTLTVLIAAQTVVTHCDLRRAFAETKTSAAAAKLEARIIDSLAYLHGPDLGFRSLLERYEAETAEDGREIMFTAIRAYSEHRFQKMGEPVDTERRKALNDYRLAIEQYDALSGEADSGQ